MDTAQIEAMIERAVSTYGRLDAAFNNAGVNSEAAALLETSDEPVVLFREEIAAAVVWLCSPAASFMVGHAMAVDGGILAR